MIGSNISLNLEGTLLTAFQIYCAKRGCQTGGEGIRNMIRELPEFKEFNSLPDDSSPSGEDINSTKSQGNSQEKK